MCIASDSLPNLGTVWKTFPSVILPCICRRPLEFSRENISINDLVRERNHLAMCTEVRRSI
ncbi:hypothetical protein RSAG8_06729, partial [Rhizoctonia solani AG-8 WAC10335]